MPALRRLGVRMRLGRLRLGANISSADLPASLPAGMAFLTGADGSFLRGADGAYLYGAA